jgi:3-oxoacyl-[acyl-carrier protein] reductase
MKARKWGRIINVLNILAKAPRGGGRAHRGLTRSRNGAHQGARQRICAHGVLANVSLVGLIVSDQWVRRHRTHEVRQATSI